MSVLLTWICLFMLRLNLWLWSRHLHKDLSSFARTEGAQQEQYQKLGVCLLRMSASSSGNCYAVCLSLQFYPISHSAAFKVKVLASQRTAAHGIPLHRVLFTEAQPPGTFPLSNPMEKNLCDHWSPYRQQLVHDAGFIIIIRSKGWLISVPLIEVRRQMDGRHLREPSICPFMAE